MAAKKRRGAGNAGGGAGANIGKARGGLPAALAMALAIPRALTVYPDAMLLNQPWTRRLWEWLDGYISLAEQWLEQRGPQLRMASLLVLTSGLTLLVAAAYSDFRSANNDSFYHIGLAREYAKGWVDSYKWLPHTPLAQDPFPNLYLLMHLVLAPVHWFIHDGMEAHKFSRALAGVAMMGAVFWAQWMFRNPLGAVLDPGQRGRRAHLHPLPALAQGRRPVLPAGRLLVLRPGAREDPLAVPAGPSPPRWPTPAAGCWWASRPSMRWPRATTPAARACCPSPPPCWPRPWG